VKKVTLAEVEKHNKDDDCWSVCHGVVYDLTKFLDQHPGGSEVITVLAGKDSSEDFEDIGHSEEARKQGKDYVVGVLEGQEELIEQLEAKGWKITDGMARSTETGNQDFVVFIDKTHTTVPWNVGGDSLVILLELNSYTLSHSEVRLLGFDGNLFNDDTSGM